ncbi:MAG TPA: DUF1572 family protein [Bryobacteraceae bacterium]|nr:DUF1572 family protein [Bryobacteraceae bacterium]
MAIVNPATELAALYRRDITRLLQQLRAFEANDAALWQTLPGVTNSAGHLMLHLEGNLREYVGRRLGNLPFTRQRDQEFSALQVPAADLAHRIEELRDTVPDIIAAIKPEALDAVFPDKLRGLDLSTQQYLIHTLSHFNYHLGQIDYLRRILLQANALDLAGL